MAALMVFTLHGGSVANAAIVRWDGGGADTFWDTGANWSGDVAPGPLDEVIFDATSTKNCVIRTSEQVFSLKVAAGYGGSISASGGSLLSTGT